MSPTTVASAEPRETREDGRGKARERCTVALGTVRHGAWLSVVEVTGLSRPKKRLRVALAAVDSTF